MVIVSDGGNMGGRVTVLLIGDGYESDDVCSIRDERFRKMLFHHHLFTLDSGLELPV